MKKVIIMLVAGLLAQPIMLRAQSTLYVSSLNPTPTSSASVGSNSWLAAAFNTGGNAGGYILDSIELGMANASGDPGGFTVMLYTNISPPSGAFPGGILATLTGSSDPDTSGVYTYSPASTLTLSPYTVYEIVVTAETSVANGAYNWIESAYPPNSSGGWNAANAFLQSNNGLSPWSEPQYTGIAQFAIDATAIPEPGILGLFALGGVGFLWRCRKGNAP